MIGTILIIIIVLALLGGLPFGGRTMGYGYGAAPMGGLGLIVVILLVLVLMGRI